MSDKLAVLGGPAVFPDGPPNWPLPDEDIATALRNTYESGVWGQYDGPNAELLQEKLKAFHGSSHAYLCSSGTIAVELALRGLLVGPEDEVILPGYDFAGNFRAIEAVGARPVLIDIEPQTWCLDPEQFEAALSPKSKAVIVSHLHGGLADMPAIRELADRAGVAVVEDACQAPGAEVLGRPAGASGDVGILSFGGSKLLTSGRGGAIVTNRAEIVQRIRVHCERGNHACPLSELQATVLCPQIDKLAERNRQRWENVQRLVKLLHDVTMFGFPRWRSGCSPSFFKLGVACRTEGLNADRAGLMNALQGEGVAIGEGFRGFSQRKKRSRSVGPLENVKAAAGSTLLLHHPILLSPQSTIDRLAHAFRKVADHIAEE